MVVWVDFGGFNRLLAERAAALSIPVVCLFPGGLGLRERRADRLARCVTHVASVLPFEADFYRRNYYDLKVTYVGHPLVDRVRPQLAPEEWRQRHGLTPTEKVILLMPGSRRQEVLTLFPVMLAAAANWRRPGMTCGFPAGGTDDRPSIGPNFTGTTSRLGGGDNYLGGDL